MKQPQDSRKKFFHRMRKTGRHALEHSVANVHLNKGHDERIPVVSKMDYYNVDRVVTRSDMNVAGDTLSQFDDEDLPLPILQQCKQNKEKRDRALMDLADAVNALDKLQPTHIRESDVQEQSGDIKAGPGTIDELEAWKAAIHNLSNAFACAQPFHKNDTGFNADSDVLLSNKYQVKRIKRKPVPVYYGVTTKQSFDNDVIRQDSHRTSDDIVSVDETLEYTSAPYLRRISFSRPMHRLDVDTGVDFEKSTSLSHIISLTPVYHRKKMNRAEQVISTLVKDNDRLQDSDEMDRQSPYIRSSTMYAGRSIGLPMLELDLPNDTCRFSQDYSTTRYSSESHSDARSSRGNSVSSFESMLSVDQHSSTGPSSVSSLNSSPASNNVELPNPSDSLGLTNMHIGHRHEKSKSMAPCRPNRHPHRYSTLTQTKRQPMVLDSVCLEDEVHTYIIDYDQYISSNDETPRPGALGFPI